MHDASLGDVQPVQVDVLDRLASDPRDGGVDPRDLFATQRNTMADAWDFLTKHPSEHTSTNHPLKGELSTVTRDGRSFDQWQHELSGGARICFYLDGLVNPLLR